MQLACLRDFFLSCLLTCSGAPVNWLELLLLVGFDLLGYFTPVLGHPCLGLQVKQQNSLLTLILPVHQLAHGLVVICTPFCEDNSLIQVKAGSQSDPLVLTHLLQQAYLDRTDREPTCMHVYWNTCCC